jgi:RHS repeat-associated protein
MTMKGSTMVLLRSLLLFAVFMMTLTLSANLPALAPGKARYLVVLWEQGTPIPGSNGKHTGKIEEPDFAKAGGLLLATRRNQRIIDVPARAAAQLRKHRSVAYMQRIWMGEDIAELSEAPYATDTRSRLQSEDDPLLTWGPKSYTYDGSGNIVKIGQTAAYDNYTYDTAGRLIESTVGGQTETYEYDSFGNLISKGINGANMQSIPVDGSSNRVQSVIYDAAGNITSRGSQTFGYDAFNVMTNHKERRMLYDANDERIGILLDAFLSRWWIRDLEGRVLREYKGSPTFNEDVWAWKQDYLYAEGRLVAGERVLWNAGYDGGNDSWFGGVRHYHLDHLGSVRLATNSAGRSVSQHDYYPFGVTPTKAYQEQINWADPHIDAMRFAGHQREFLGLLNTENTDYLDYMHARFYDPNLGRFLSVDPVMDTKTALVKPQSWNRYSYVRNNPINATDPDGRLTVILSGTFAEDAVWHKKGTVFNKAVSQRFGEQAVTFRWSGDNTKVGRAEAAKQLQAFIDKHRKSGEPLNIVAHSHGGNVVKAYTQSKGAQQVDTLITLGTPQRSDYKLNSAMVGSYINVFSRADNIQTLGDKWWAAGANRAGRTDPLAQNVDVTHANGSPAGVGHSELHTPEVLEQLPPE